MLLSSQRKRSGIAAATRPSAGKRFTHRFVPRLERLEERTLLDAGMLDTAFGSGGLVTTDFGGIDSVAGAVRQPDGKIVVAGTTTPTGGEPIAALARYNFDGSLDTSFGLNGTGKAVL